MDNSLVELRTHLQVAMLAVGQLRRKCRLSCEAERFARYADDALIAMRQDMEKISGEVAMREDREVSRTAHLLPSYATSETPRTASQMTPLPGRLRSRQEASIR
jgi:hypothetical protein